MCGIAGFATKDPRGVDPAALRDSIELLAHRGPDDLGFLSVGRGARYHGRDLSRQIPAARLLLVHRRLSILDLSEAGWQPMSSADGNLFITFNGEIYNHLELRSELEALGHRFRSNSDTEVLLAAYREWGAAALSRLIGMFAFAIYDQQREEILLARDFFGIKPLFYAVEDDQFGFASEIKVLLKSLGLSRQVTADRLFSYLRYGLTDYGCETMFQSVRQLEAGHYLRVDLQTMQVSEPVR